MALGWLLIRERRFDEAETVLRGAGHPAAQKSPRASRNGLSTIERSRRPLNSRRFLSPAGTTS